MYVPGARGHSPPEGAGFAVAAAALPTPGLVSHGWRAAARNRPPADASQPSLADACRRQPPSAPQPTHSLNRTLTKLNLDLT